MLVRSRFSVVGNVWVVASVLALLTIVLSWPGSLIGDSLNQLAEIKRGRLTDWHPPLMAVIWRALGATPQSMLVLQTSIYWFGFALIADELRRVADLKWGFAILIVGLTPMSLIYIGVVQKDTLLTAFFILSVGLSVRFGRVYGVIPGLLAALTRANAVFAFPPLIINKQRLSTNIALCLAISLALIPASQFVNLSLVGAERSNVEKSLQLFDMAGIESVSGRQFLGPSVSRCYSPFYWDTLELDCGAFKGSGQDLTRPWINAIAAEPIAYLGHRLNFYNHTIFFLVPPLQECVYVPRWHDCAPGGNSLLKDAVVRNAFLWPVTWLVVGVMLLFMPLERTARMLTLSGLFYGLGYLVVGVASGFRYFYWTELAIQVGLVWQIATGGLPKWRWIAAAVLLLWVIGYAYRYGPFLF
jgi:hypothetical protein